MGSRLTKKIIFIGSTTVTTGATISMPTGSGEDMAARNYTYCDVLINLKSIGATGGSPGLTVAVQEKFADNAGADLWVETANSGSVTGTGTFFITNGDSSGHTGDKAKNSALGKGGTKRFVTTLAGSPTSVSADIYLILYD